MEHGDCVVCGDNIHDDPDVLESYVLTHIYLVKKNGLAEVAAPGTGHDVTFCGPKCLTRYVNAKIAPDA